MVRAGPSCPCTCPSVPEPSLLSPTLDSSVAILAPATVNFGGDGEIIDLEDALLVVGEWPFLFDGWGGEDDVAAELMFDESVEVESNELMTAWLALSLLLLLLASARTAGSEAPKYPSVANWIGMSSARESSATEEKVVMVVIVVMVLSGRSWWRRPSADLLFDEAGAACR